MAEDWMDELPGVKDVQQADDTVLPRRSKMKIGAGLSAADDPINGRTLIEADAYLGEAGGASAIDATNFTLVGWGAGATVAVDAGSNDRRGGFTVTAGTGAAVDATVALAYETPYATAPWAVVQRNDDSAPALSAMDVRVQSRSTTQFVAAITNGSAPTDGESYSFTYIVQP